MNYLNVIFYKMMGIKEFGLGEANGFLKYMFLSEIFGNVLIFNNSFRNIGLVLEFFGCNI